jgi:hypothetical protein
MKALISPAENKRCEWISGWILDGTDWYPEISVLDDCKRIVQVSTDDNVFSVAAPLFWMECVEECNPMDYYFKEGEINKRPDDVALPDVAPEE